MNMNIIIMRRIYKPIKVFYLILRLISIWAREMCARHLRLINIVWLMMGMIMQGGDSDTSSYRGIPSANLHKVVCGTKPTNPNGNPATFRVGVAAKAAAKSQDLWPFSC